MVLPTVALLLSVLTPGLMGLPQASQDYNNFSPEMFEETIYDVQDPTLYLDDSSPSQEEYDLFFNLVEGLLWDHDETDEEGRQFRVARGWMGMRRPAFLSRRSGEPSNMYRSLVDGCFDLMCKLGINGMLNRMGRLLGYQK